MRFGTGLVDALRGGTCGCASGRDLRMRFGAELVDALRDTGPNSDSDSDSNVQFPSDLFIHRSCRR